MELLVWIIVGALATWRLTHDMTNKMELDGPFQLYAIVRAFFRDKRMAKWLRDGIDCPYCVSFWVGHVVSALLPIYGGMQWYSGLAAYCAVAWALSGAIVVYLRRMQVLYGMDADEV